MTHRQPRVSFLAEGYATGTGWGLLAGGAAGAVLVLGVSLAPHPADVVWSVGLVVVCCLIGAFVGSLLGAAVGAVVGLLLGALARAGVQRLRLAAVLAAVAVCTALTWTAVRLGAVSQVAELAGWTTPSAEVDALTGAAIELAADLTPWAFDQRAFYMLFLPPVLISCGIAHEWGRRFEALQRANRRPPPARTPGAPSHRWQAPAEPPRLRRRDVPAAERTLGT